MIIFRVDRFVCSLAESVSVVSHNSKKIRDISWFPLQRSWCM